MRKVLFLICVLFLASMIMVPSEALARGTAAGTKIINQAYSDYKDANNNAMPRVYSNIVTITVSGVAAVSIIPEASASAAKNGDVVRYLVQLYNYGNGDDSQTFTYSIPGSSEWTPTSVKMYYDVSHDHAYTPGTDVLLTETTPGSKTFKTVSATGQSFQTKADDDYDVIMEVTVPGVVV